MSKEQHKKIYNFIRVIRESFPDASIIYQWGACYGFYLILKHNFPSAIAYFSDKDKDHILTKIGNRFYDITGEYDYETKEATKLKEKDHQIWISKAFGQRVEYILSKYNRHIKKHTEPFKEK